jgi:hypothetical protein
MSLPAHGYRDAGPHDRSQRSDTRRPHYPCGVGAAGDPDIREVSHRSLCEGDTRHIDTLTVTTRAPEHVETYRSAAGCRG